MFIKDFGTLAQPLTTLLKVEGCFQWNEEADQAFCKLKQALVTTLVLALPDFSLQFPLHLLSSCHRTRNFRIHSAPLSHAQVRQPTEIIWP